jgi:hypothetical protein
MTDIGLIGFIGEILLLLPVEDTWIWADGVVVVVLATVIILTDGLFDPKLLGT